MTTLLIKGPSSVSGSVSVPGDKSISHRALMLGAAASGRTTVRNIAPGADVAATMSCLEAYGVRVERREDMASVHSRGIVEWTAPESILDCGNSGTTMRVLAGLAARCVFETTLDGDASLRRRPMERVAEPLRAFGAKVRTADDGRPPMSVAGGTLRGADVDTGVASAQVKTAAIFAALGAEGPSTVTEPLHSRDHTERILQALGVQITEQDVNGHHVVEIIPAPTPPFDLAVPGDPSSAAFIVCAAVLAGEVHIDQVALNPMRIGYLELLSRMGADVRWETLEDRMNESVGFVDARASSLTATTVDEALVPRLHDELPVLAVVATQAEGETVVRGARELRIKESDRIAALTDGLRRLGADIDELDDGFVVRGPTQLVGTTVDAYGDHRIAMALAVAGLVAAGETRITGYECADVSWPGFDALLRSLGVEVTSE
jgi:3-phosphoshikimate 1-carboxyvinyltransferase